MATPLVTGSDPSAARTRGHTMAEKLLSRAAGRRVRAGDTIVCAPDGAMGTDGSIPMALDYLQQMQPAGAPLPPPQDPSRFVFALDHYGPESGERALAMQRRARDYALAHGVRVFDAGEGIGHQLLIEQALALPGQLVVGADSHAVSYGALNAFGTGIGSSDFAALLQCGQLWLKVPASCRVRLQGALGAGVSAKDVALTLARRLGADGANYLALEFDGPGVAALDMNDRIVLANMSVEMGAKAGLFPFDACTGEFLRGRTSLAFDAVAADPDADYASCLDIDLAQVTPQVALPHRVDQVVDAADAPATRVDMVYLGTCSGGRAKDFHEALEVLRAGGGIAPGVRLVVTPASEAVRAELAADGALAQFEAFGAEIRAPGCGGCCGTCGSIPAAGDNVVSTANRNFKGRMGNGEARIFLASARTCAAAAVRGTLGTRKDSR